jgi:hypothetical protein
MPPATRPDVQGKIYGTEEAVASLIIELTSVQKEKIKGLTELDDQEIGVLTVLNVIGERLDISSLIDFVTNFCQFRVSRFRMGRREMVDIASYTISPTDDRRKFKSMRDLFGGMGGR